MNFVFSFLQFFFFTFHYSNPFVILATFIQIPLHVDGKNTYYLVDPGGDLHDTRTLFSKLLKKYDCWKGCVGEAPQSKDLLQFMETSNFFLQVFCKILRLIISINHFD